MITQPVHVIQTVWYKTEP